MHRCKIFLPLMALCAVALPSCGTDEDIEGGSNEPPVDDVFRPATAKSSALCDKVYEWTPAPGQFINEPVTGGMTTDIKTAGQAAEWARERLAAGRFVSLGGFGGYIVVGFDHSVKASDADYDFGVAGNAFLNSGTGKGGSNEPGIVYVMRDENGNGLPDDTWYELAGSETNREGTLRDYAVTYRRPAAPGMDVEWTDNKGGSGTIDYLAAIHKQDYYYPLWIADDTYTLKGTCLRPQTSMDETTGQWNNEPYAWGYADNMGSDNAATERFPQCNRFKISDAIAADGTPAKLAYIDFVKVQTGVNSKSGALGEVSTEVFGVIDLHLNR